MNILSAEQFSPPMLEELGNRADFFREQRLTQTSRRELAGRYTGEILTSLFYEPSTRTRLSFEVAAQCLGMAVNGTENAHVFTSAVKGETLEHTARVLGEYSPSIIVLRHDLTGSAKAFAEAAAIPVINGGDGKGEHPTQAALDIYTIKEQKGRLDNLNVVIGGDLANGRTARSLAKLLAHYDGNNITFVSTPELQIGQDIKDYLDSHGTAHTETCDMYDALRTSDVVYWTRLQLERMTKSRLGKLRQKVGLKAKVSEKFVIDQTALKVLPKDSVIMHPMPISGEITSEVQKDPRAVFIHQAGSGVPLRMAFIEMVLSESGVK